jgi:hypothetical protein
MENRNGSRDREQVTHTSAQQKDGDRVGFSRKFRMEKGGLPLAVL